MSLLFRPNPSSGVPIYLQLMEQVKHAVETGALRPGEQLPGIRKVAEDLVMNPNTVAKAYRELEHEGVIELRHGAGAFIRSDWGNRSGSEDVEAAQGILRGAVQQLQAMQLTEDQIRRMFEGALAASRQEAQGGKNE